MIRLDKPKKKGGCSCGGTCSGCKKKGRLSRQSPSSDMDRDDALSPTEYLAACDLGIQGRSRPYIRARLDAATQLEEGYIEEREDQKCGKSGIGKGKKCKKPQTAVGLGARIGGGIGATAGGLRGAQYGFFGSRKSGFGAGKTAAWTAAGSGAGAAVNGLMGAGLGAGIGAIVRASRDKDTKKRRGDAMPTGKGGKKCGNSTIPANKQCRAGGAGSTIGKVAAAAGTAALGVAAYKNRGAIKSAAKTTVGAVRSGASRVKNTAVAVAANPGNSARRARRRATVAAGRGAQAGAAMAASAGRAADYQRRNVARTATRVGQKMNAKRTQKQLSLF